MSAIPRDEFVSSIARLAGSVYDFHERFKESPLVSMPSEEKSLDILRGRLPLLVEELGEFAQDINKGNLRDASLEMADVTFVAIGTMLALNTTGVQSSHAVAQKNDDKTLDTHMVEASSGKLVRKSQAK